MSSEKDIILFHYHYSPYAKRIVWYLQLRKIPYTQCMQPPILPRPDVNSLGIQYRRIPLLSIGRTVYIDTRTILSALERLYPPSTSHPSISASNPEHVAIERLLSKWIVEGPVFMRASQLIPTSMPTLQDPKFLKDREQMTGRPWTKESVEKMRPEALADIKAAITLLETTLLSDGRSWVLATPAPSLADIQAIWPFVWVHGMPGALDAQHISAAHFPKVFAWIGRFLAATKEASRALGKAKTVKGPEAMRSIGASAWVEEVKRAAGEDPTGLKAGQEVEVWPTDSGSRNRDRGVLVALDELQIVWATRTEEGKEIEVHMPRQGFRIRAVGGAAKL